MKNESGVNEDITMLDALQRLWHHKAKRKTFRIEMQFDYYYGKVHLWQLCIGVINHRNRTVQVGKDTKL